MSSFFPIEEADLALLSSRDPKLAKAIACFGPLKREVHPGAFRGLLRAISGQQISGAAIAQAPEDALRSCGLSARKASYAQSAARLFASGELCEEALAAMPEAELRPLLTALPGVGPWTVDMLLIFSQQRKDVLSKGDLGIQRGLRMLHGREAISPEFFEECRALYSPLGSIASFYLWEIASGKHPQWRDPARGGA